MYKLIAMSVVVSGTLLLHGCGGGEETQAIPKMPDKDEVKEEAEKLKDEMKDEANKMLEEKSDTGRRERTFARHHDFLTVMPLEFI